MHFAWETVTVRGQDAEGEWAEFSHLSAQHRSTWQSMLRYTSQSRALISFSSTVDRQVTIVKEYPGVSSQQLYDAWTVPAFLDPWFSNPDIPDPKGEPVVIDVRPGGVWRHRVMLDYTTEYNTGGVYKHVEPPSRLVFVWGADGGTPSLEEDITIEVTFENVDNTGRMTLSMRLPETWSAEAVNLNRLGWEMALQRFKPAPA